MRRRISLILAVCLMVCACLVGWAMAETVTTSSSLAVIRQQDTELAVGRSKTLTVTFDRSVKRTNAAMAWYSSDESIARVNNNGTVTGVGPGRAVIWCQITLKSGEVLNASAIVTVIQPVERIVFTAEKQVTVGQGASIRVAARTLPENASNTALEWRTGDANVATVDADGTVHGLMTGRTRLTVRAADGYGASAAIDVQVSPLYAEVTELVLDTPETAELRIHYAGQQFLEDYSVTLDSGAVSYTIQTNEAVAYTVNTNTAAAGGTAAVSTSVVGTGGAADITTVTTGTAPTIRDESGGSVAIFHISPRAITAGTHLVIRDKKNQQYQADVLILVTGGAISNAQRLAISSAEILTEASILAYRLELTNNASAEIGEIGFLVDYRDQFGDTHYLYSNNDGTIQNYSYTTMFNIQPGETLPLIGRNDAFRSNDIITEVRVAVNYYRFVESGEKVYIPDNQLYWYSTKTGEMPRPESTGNYTQPDVETTDKADRITYNLRATMCDLYSYVVKPFCRSYRPGKYIAAIGEGGYASAWGLKAQDVIYGADEMLWAEDPFFLNRAFAKVYDGESVMLKVVRNGEEIEIPIQKNLEE